MVATQRWYVHCVQQSVSSQRRTKFPLFHLVGLVAWLCTSARSSANEKHVSVAVSSRRLQECKKHGYPEQPDCPWAYVVQRKARAPVAADETDEVTVYFYAEVPAKNLRFTLPERQQCDDDDPDSANVYDADSRIEDKNNAGKEKGTDTDDENNAMPCDGYKFAMVGNSCNLIRSVQSEKDGRRTGVDLVKKNIILKCDVLNEAGEGEHVRAESAGKGSTSAVIPKRSMVNLELSNSDGNEVTGWQHFTIVVRNPLFTPAGRDVLGIESNTFMLALFDKQHRRIGGPHPERGLIFIAKPIQSRWICVYSEWVTMSTCTAQCGTGERYETRRLLNPPPKTIDVSLLSGCDEELVKSRPCETDPCPVDCVLSDWMRWSDGPCTASCGGGVEVLRRRVVKAPIAGGAKCVPWDDPLRVWRRPCNVEPCVEEVTRCEPSFHTDLDGVSKREIVELPCTQYCGTGMRHYADMIEFKDQIVEQKDVRHSGAESCGLWRKEPCNIEPCQAFEFFSAVSGSMPIKGQWFNVVVSFKPEMTASNLKIVVPVGFEIDKASLKEDKRNCILMEHNLPRVAYCEVTTTEIGGKQHDTMVFEFLSPLEPLQCEEDDDNEAGCIPPSSVGSADLSPVAYQVNFWVKHPSDCPDDVTSNGICLGGERDWMLAGYGADSGSPVWYNSAAGYELFDSISAAKKYKMEFQTGVSVNQDHLRRLQNAVRNSASGSKRSDKF